MMARKNGDAYVQYYEDPYSAYSMDDNYDNVSDTDLSQPARIQCLDFDEPQTSQGAWSDEYSQDYYGYEIFGAEFGDMTNVDHQSCTDTYSYPQQVSFPKTHSVVSSMNPGQRRRHAVDQLEFTPDVEYDIPSFLRKTRLHKYTPQLTQNSMNFARLLQVRSEQELERLGVSAKGARNRLLLAIQKYNEQSIHWNNRPRAWSDAGDTAEKEALDAKMEAEGLRLLQNLESEDNHISSHRNSPRPTPDSTSGTRSVPVLR